MFTKLLDLISTDSSYKNYRNALKSCSPPMLPWIGVALSDLTVSKIKLKNVFIFILVY